MAPVHRDGRLRSGLGSFRTGPVAIASGIVRTEDIPSTSALLMLNINMMLVAGPAIGGLVNRQLGFAPTYEIAIACSVLGLLMILLMQRVPPASSHGPPLSLKAVADAFTYLRKERCCRVICHRLRSDGLRYASSRLPRSRHRVLPRRCRHLRLARRRARRRRDRGGVRERLDRQRPRPGLGIIVSVLVWGVAIALVGVVPVLAVAIVMLALAGAADLVSGIYRNTILQTSVPDDMRGRMTAVLFGMANGGNRVGDAETGAAAAIGGARFAVWSGGVACIVGALCFAARVPSLLRYDQQRAIAARIASETTHESP